MSFRTLSRLLLAVYAVGLGVVGFFPTPIDRDASPAVWWFIKSVRRLGMPWFSYELLEFSANVLLFVPFGLLLVFVLGRRFWWLALLVGVATTVVIETGQWMLLPERFPSTTDIVANALGAALGVAVGLLLLVTRERRFSAAR